LIPLIFQEKSSLFYRIKFVYLFLFANFKNMDDAQPTRIAPRPRFVGSTREEVTALIAFLLRPDVPDA
jgi:hypothetical protein